MKGYEKSSVGIYSFSQQHQVDNKTSLKLHQDFNKTLVKWKALALSFGCLSF